MLMYPVFRIRFVGGGSTPLASPMVRDLRDLRGQARATDLLSGSLPRYFSIFETC